MSQFRLALFLLSVRSVLGGEVVFIRMGQKSYNLQERRCTRWVRVARFGVTGVASVRTFPKFPPCPTEPVPRWTPPLARTEPISSAGSTSGIMYSGWVEREILHNYSRERGVRICEKQFCCRPRALWGRRGRKKVFQAQGSSLQPWRSTCNPWRTLCQCRWMPKRRMWDPVGSPHWSCRHVERGAHTLRQVSWQDLWPHRDW